MTMVQKDDVLPSGVTYVAMDRDYFEKRSLRRYAGIWTLWALGVGAGCNSWAGRTQRPYGG